jgi:hypothetical protein
VKDNNVYVRVVFHIDIPEYMTDRFTEEVGARFGKEIMSILSPLDFDFGDEPLEYCQCPEGERGFENLYCHPTSVTGYLAQDQINEVVSALSSAQSFKLWKADTHEHVMNYTEDEFRQELYNRHEHIVNEILEYCTTKRSNLYVDSSFVKHVQTGIPIHNKFPTGNRLQGIALNYVAATLQSLVDNGAIITANTRNGIGYRTVQDKSKGKKKAV